MRTEYQINQPFVALVKAYLNLDIDLRSKPQLGFDTCVFLCRGGNDLEHGGCANGVVVLYSSRLIAHTLSSLVVETLCVW